MLFLLILILRYSFYTYICLLNLIINKCFFILIHLQCFALLIEWFLFEYFSVMLTYQVLTHNLLVCLKIKNEYTYTLVFIIVNNNNLNYSPINICS